ncbi:MAG TPA: aspartyl/glutamyl-tRNA amidotransferase subunit C [Anaerolineaceae bacterium]|nr:aspartyl/glutamyl-tRNA amidotransferase subunit C [Anaerolineaceae bacterium]HQH57976.1 aspartyl/glutamyl-tRNA amidotransferase subunit C [Anaerolineaceae bacterium]HQK04137.1 aspartyl/glutamyl-tRNA amidotransferase subunit C [Anaerolineaceae bacterium]
MTPDYITPELFAKLVTLAALELTPEESEYLRTELNHQLAAVKELSEIKLAEGVQPSLHGLDCQGNPPRPDEWLPFPDSAAILALAPESNGEYFHVPDFRRGGEEAK